MPNTEEKYRALLNAYQSDAYGFASIINNSNIKELLESFGDYNKFINEQLKKTKPAKLINSLSKKNGIIQSTNRTPALKQVFSYAHLAACCELFRDWTIPSHLITPDNLSPIIQNSLSPCLHSVEKLNEIETRVHNSDAVRTAHILKNLGLINSKNKNIRQLSFAAGHGNRDIDGFHAIPEIRQQNILSSNATESTLKFRTKVNNPEYVILIDNAPEFSQQYALINKDQSDWIIALNKDVDKALDQLPDILKKTHRKPVNLILGLRIDHNMIPDVNYFFKQITPLIDNTADLVISIGAGHTLDEFRGRKKKIQEIFHYLKQHGLNPVDIQLHGDGSLEEQRLSPSFGSLHYTSYEILYCKLKKKNFQFDINTRGDI